GPDGGHAGAAAPLRVAVAPEPVDEHDPFLYHKTTRREAYRARAAARPDCDDVILVNRRGEPTETTTANLVLELDGERYTPPVEVGLLPGIFRAQLLERGEVRTRRLTAEDLRRADGVWLINSVRGWRRATLVK
ncbi:MAG: aminotransferase class IV, partial [Gemmatimonadota bacterium]